MAKIDFTLNAVAHTLRNRFDGSATLQKTGGRFTNWTPLSKPVGDVATRQADGVLHRFRYRDDYGASFELRDIAMHGQGGLYMPDIADLLRYHLLNGGECAIDCEDNDGHAYAHCGLMPGTEPQLTMQDGKGLVYTLSLSVINIAVAPVPLLCHYGRL